MLLLFDNEYIPIGYDTPDEILYKKFTLDNNISKVLNYIPEKTKKELFKFVKAENGHPHFIGKRGEYD